MAPQDPTLIDHVTAMIITFNEAPNIGRVLEKLAWVRRVLVIDSGSTDETLEIIARHPGAKVLTRGFDSFAAQCNFGLDHIKTEWVLSLDADYVLSDALIEELRALSPSATVSGYRAAFRYAIHGAPLRGTLYPPRTVLYRKARARYVDVGHAHRVVVTGEMRPLAGVIVHDDRKPLSRWFASQQSYALREARHLLDTPAAELSRTARLRRLAWPAPLLAPAYALLVKGCILDGWAGWFYVLQRLLAETMIALAIIDFRLGPPSDRQPSGRASS